MLSAALAEVKGYVQVGRPNDDPSKSSLGDGLLWELPTESDVSFRLWDALTLINHRNDWLPPNTVNLLEPIDNRRDDWARLWQNCSAAQSTKIRVPRDGGPIFESADLFYPLFALCAWHEYFQDYVESKIRSLRLDVQEDFASALLILHVFSRCRSPHIFSWTDEALAGLLGMLFETGLAPDVRYPPGPCEEITIKTWQEPLSAGESRRRGSNEVAESPWRSFLAQCVVDMVLPVTHKGTMLRFWKTLETWLRFNAEVPLYTIITELEIPFSRTRSIYNMAVGFRFPGEDAYLELITNYQ
ncbi:hypothetical protein M011DRAFT_267818 [Sporormia fimetaria CBS 119925]|uniref:Uncharacterized protein n=1 Tax=Sporormia fimetaria CBS 119925 TaxID=1340428 RepID=A0A6A6UXJ9_9PLEO|nr:hypothetical protein M011DRAFT_267818 [Sporormia fimetaria CBS 119925]